MCPRKYIFAFCWRTGLVILGALWFSRTLGLEYRFTAMEGMMWGLSRMVDLSTRYVLPTIFRNEDTQFRVFVLAGSTGKIIHDIHELAAELGKRETVGKIEIFCEVGYSEADGKRYAEMLDAAIPDDICPEIIVEIDVPLFALQQLMLMTRVENAKRRALLN